MAQRILSGPPGTSLHESLPDLQGGGVGERYHLTAAQRTGLVGGGATALHSHAAPAHGDLSGLQGGGVGERYHLTQAQHDGLVGGAQTTLHSHPAAAGWQDLTNPAKASATSIGVDDVTLDMGDRGRPIRYRTSGGDWKYGQATNVMGGGPPTTITIRGAAVPDDVADVQIGPRSYLRSETFCIPGAWADGASSVLLEEDTLMEGGYLWTGGRAYIVGIDAVVGGTDTGATQPKVNLVNSGTSSLLSTGLDASSSLVSSEEVDDTAYELAYGYTIELSTDGLGSNDDSVDLTVHVHIVTED